MAFVSKKYANLAQNRIKQLRKENKKVYQDMRKPLPKKLRESVLSRYNFKCAYCGKKSERLQCDHIVPVLRGGTDDESNLNPACQSCNNFKMAFTLEEFRSELFKQVERARKTSLNFRLAERYGLIVETGREIKFYFERVRDGEL